MTPPTELDDRFTTLLAEYGPRLDKVVSTYGVTSADRDDLRQEIMVQLWRSFRSYDRERPFATWMYRVALNVAISHVRAVSARRRVHTDSTGATLDPPDPRTPGADDDPRMELLQGLLSNLDALDRALLLLHLEERSYREIADVLGLSESNVGTKLNRIRQRLRQLAARLETTT